jgi:hypothetical protein
MSKWTLEKILACDEIKEGAYFSYEEFERCLVLLKDETGFVFWDKIVNRTNAYHGTQYWHLFKFYRASDMTEILPPKDKKKILKKFWVNFYEHEHIGVYITKEAADQQVPSILKRIACEYFEREVEVDCE